MATITSIEELFSTVIPAQLRALRDDLTPLGGARYVIAVHDGAVRGAQPKCWTIDTAAASLAVEPGAASADYRLTCDAKALLALANAAIAPERCIRQMVDAGYGVTATAPGKTLGGEAAFMMAVRLLSLCCAP